MVQEIVQPRADEIDWWRIADAITQISSVADLTVQEVTDAFGDIDPRAQYVTALRFGKDQSRSFGEIAKTFGHTEGWARHIQSQALVTMREAILDRRDSEYSE